jgi:hypothetical protein
MRWIGKDREMKETPNIDKFLEDIGAVCKKHGYSISHEDFQGSFEVEAYSEANRDWLSRASVGDTVDTDKL